MGSSGTRTFEFDAVRACGGFTDDDDDCRFVGEVELHADPETGCATWVCPRCGWENGEEL